MIELILISMVIILSVVIGVINRDPIKKPLKTLEATSTLSASFIGPVTLLFYTAMVGIYGLGALWMFFGYLAGFFLMAFVGPVIYKETKDGNMEEFLDKKIGRCASQFIAFVVVLWFFIMLASQFVGSGYTVSQIGGGESYWWIIIIALTLLIYLSVGDIRALIETDVFQMIAIILSSLIVYIAVLFHTELVFYIPWESLFALTPFTLFTLLLFGALTPIAQKDNWQRIAIIKEPKRIRNSFIFSGVVVFVFILFLTYIGLLAKINFPTLVSDNIFIIFLEKILPPSILGCVGVLLLAAILSTMDTVLFATASMFMNIFGIKKSKIKFSLIMFFIVASCLLIAFSYPSLTNLTFIFKSIGLIASPLIIISLLNLGDGASAIFSIIVSLFVVGLIILMGWTSLGMNLVSIIAVTVSYFIFYTTKKILKKFF